MAALGLDLGTTVAVPDPPAGWFHYDCNVLMDGRLVLLRDDRDFRGRHARWIRDASFKEPPTMKGSRLRISIFDGRTEEAQFEAVSMAFPRLDRMADGRWLLQDATTPGAPNAFLLDANGAEAGRFVVGGGIVDMACAPGGGVWISYLDEGYFDCDPVPGPGGGQYLSSAGLARFSPGGEILWQYNQDRTQGPVIHECHALSLTGDTVWLCSEPDFPILRLDGQAAAGWSNALHGAMALAARGDHVLLAGGYGLHEDGEAMNEHRVALLHLEDGSANLVGDLLLPRATAPDRRCIRGRDGELHIVQAGQWTRISVAEAVAWFRIRRAFG